MTTPEKSPADLILAALEAAQEVMDRGAGLGLIFSGPHHRLQTALDALREALVAEELEGAAGHWHHTTWKDVKTGDRVRVAQQHEATVEEVLAATWLGSGATQVRVKLEGRPTPYSMPPSGPVEVWTPSLPEWASQAYLALAESGLEVSPRG